MKTWINALPYMIIIGLLLALFMSINTCNRVSTDNAIKELQYVYDTVTVRNIDTVYIKEPKYITRTVIDTIAIMVTDTINHIIHLPIEQKTYTTEYYEAWVSGYMPKLDSINIYKSTEIKYITNTVIQSKRKKPFGIGIHAGYGLSKNGELSPYLGVGLSYNIINF